MLSQRQTAACFVIALAAALAFVLALYSVLIELPTFLGEEVYEAVTWFGVLAWPISLPLLITGSVIAGILAYRFTERRILSWRFGSTT
jgi:hypothetical protein